MESGTLKGHIAMGAAAIIWGLMSPVSKLVMQPGEVSSASLATFRLLGAAILFWLASAFVPGETIARKDRLTLFYASLFGIIFNQMAFTVGVGFTSPADAAIITTITPVLTMILAAFVLREMITGKKIIGVCASAIGAILLVSGSGGRAAALPGDNNLLGDILCLVEGAGRDGFLVDGRPQIPSPSGTWFPSVIPHFPCKRGWALPTWWHSLPL